MNGLDYLTDKDTRFVRPSLRKSTLITIPSDDPLRSSRSAKRPEYHVNPEEEREKVEQLIEELKIGTEKSTLKLQGATFTEDPFEARKNLFPSNHFYMENMPPADLTLNDERFAYWKDFIMLSEFEAIYQNTLLKEYYHNCMTKLENIFLSKRYSINQLTGGDFPVVTFGEISSPIKLEIIFNVRRIKHVKIIIESDVDKTNLKFETPLHVIPFVKEFFRDDEKEKHFGSEEVSIIKNPGLTRVIIKKMDLKINVFSEIRCIIIKFEPDLI